MNAQRRKVNSRQNAYKRPLKRAESRESKEREMTRPTSLPFIEALEKRFNKKIQKDNEQVLLANYEKNWILKNTLGGIDGNEQRYVRYLAKKYSSFIFNQV